MCSFMHVSVLGNSANRIRVPLRSVFLHLSVRNGPFLVSLVKKEDILDIFSRNENQFYCSHNLKPVVTLEIVMDGLGARSGKLGGYSAWCSRNYASTFRFSTAIFVSPQIPVSYQILHGVARNVKWKRWHVQINFRLFKVSLSPNGLWSC